MIWHAGSCKLILEKRKVTLCFWNHNVAISEIIRRLFRDVKGVKGNKGVRQVNNAYCFLVADCSWRMTESVLFWPFGHWARWREASILHFFYISSLRILQSVTSSTLFIVITLSEGSTLSLSNCFVDLFPCDHRLLAIHGKCNLTLPELAADRCWTIFSNHFLQSTLPATQCVFNDVAPSSLLTGPLVKLYRTAF